LNKTSKLNFTYVFIGPLYICIPILLLYKIRLEHENGLEILLWCLLITWTTDIFSFFGGKIFGGRKLWVSISPNKTWSGFITGIFAAMIFSFVSFKLIGVDTTYVILWSFLLALSVQVGDLFESFIKRKHEVTESGKLLPGHGGMLDRMDGFQFCAFFLSITVVLV
jgi:phosphatidate cytidylyltransferase